MSLFPKFLATVLLGLALVLLAPAAQAQVSVNINTAPPAWGPPVPAGTQFYYIPEIDGYYDIYNQQYLVYQDGEWVATPTLDGFDPYGFHPVVLDYRGRRPWVYVTANRVRYPRAVVVRVVRPVRIVRPVQPVRVAAPGQVRKAYKEGYREGKHQGGGRRGGR